MNKTTDLNTTKKSSANMTRRGFLQTSAFLGGASLLKSEFELPTLDKSETVSKYMLEDYEYTTQRTTSIINSTCLQCKTNCSIMVKHFNNLVAKIDGSPYNPQNKLVPVRYKRSIIGAVKHDGKLCPKGHSGIQTLYDPYRLTKVLKRDGERGSNKWKTITFKQAIDEIVDGGQIFKDIGENKNIEGFKSIYALKDSQLSKKMSEDIQKLREKKLSVTDFKAKYKNNLDVLIDTEHPDAGPKNNQFIFMTGCIEGGRKEFAKRFVENAFGSINFCERSSISNRSGNLASKNVYGKDLTKSDLLNAEFVIFWGTGAFEANFGPTNMAEKVTRSLRERNFKYAVVDPRMSKTATKARYWLPVKPGGDLALAMAMISWIIENERYDKKYLENANRASASADSEPTWSNASYLVKIEKDGPSSFVRADELNLGSKSMFVVSRGGKLIAVDPEDKIKAVEGDLFVDSTTNGIKLKSGFQILKESVNLKSTSEYVDASGIEEEKIINLADEFTSHGKKVAVDFMRGVSQHTNGYYAAQAVITLNLLVGNSDWKGGLSVGGGNWDALGSETGSKYNLEKLHNNKITSFGIPITREGVKYEDSTYFKDYPAQRPWYPLTSDIYHEILPSSEDAYPYAAKILFLHKGSPALSVPGGDKLISTLKDTSKIPLFITDDIIVGETSMYADYIFPDLTYLERWGMPCSPVDINSKMSKVRQPAVAPLTEEVTVFDNKLPISMESLMLAIAEKLNLSGFGKDAFATAKDLYYPEDFYLKMVANIAYGKSGREPVKSEKRKRIKIFEAARKILSSSVFDSKRWQSAIQKKEWRKVVYVLNRGGRFEDFNKSYDGQYMTHKLASMLNIYCEDVATTTNSLNGKRFVGVPIFEPVLDYAGKEVKDADFKFNLITYKEVFASCSRTISNYWSQGSLLPENEILINSMDAEKDGIEHGSYVKLVSKSNPEGIVDLKNGSTHQLLAKVRVIEGIRPGVLALSWHYGHWAYGSNDIIVDNKKVKGDPRRKKGTVPNPLFRMDDSIKNVSIGDPLGGSASANDTRINIIKT